MKHLARPAGELSVVSGQLARAALRYVSSAWSFRFFLWATSEGIRLQDEGVA